MDEIINTEKKEEQIIKEEIPVIEPVVETKQPEEVNYIDNGCLHFNFCKSVIVKGLPNRCCHNPSYFMDKLGRQCNLLSPWYPPKEVKKIKDLVEGEGVTTNTNVPTNENKDTTIVNTIKDNKPKVSRLGRIRELLKENKLDVEIVEIVKKEFPDASPSIIKGQIYLARKAASNG